MRAPNLFIGMLAPLLLASLPAASVLTVPGQYATIKAAIDAAQPFDVVEVGPGVWNESIMIERDSITLRGSGIDVTIIDCELQHQAVRIDARGTTIEDLTIERGRANRGGGVWMLSGSCTIRDCVFRLCRARSTWLGNPAFDRFSSRDGGAVCAEAGTALVLEGVSFENNTATESGGAVACYGDELRVSQCLFSANVAGQAIVTRGGGLFALTDDVEILDSDFYENYLHESIDANLNTGGGAVSIMGDRARVEGCLFERNHTEYSRGMALRIQGSDAEVAWCLFDHNVSLWNGGPAAHFDGDNAHVHHCMFVGNYGEYSGSLYCFGEGGHLEWIDLIGNGEGGITIRGSTNISDVLFEGFHSHYGAPAVRVSGSGGGVARRLQVDGDGYSPTGLITLVDTQYEIYDSQFIDCRLGGPYSSNNVMQSLGSTVLLDGCTIAGSSVLRPGSEPKTTLSGTGFTIRSSILWNPLLDGELASDAVADITFSNVSGGAPGIGNVDLDPGFVNAAGPEPHDYRLQSTSPLIDAGSPSTLGLRLDAQKGARRIDGDLDGIAVVDMGAFEYTDTLLVADAGGATMTLTGPPNSMGLIAVGQSATALPLGHFGTLYFDSFNTLFISPVAPLPLQVVLPALPAGAVTQGLAITPSGAGQVSNPLR